MTLLNRHFSTRELETVEFLDNTILMIQKKTLQMV